MAVALRHVAAISILALLLLLPATRKAILLQNELGATIPFLLFALLSLAPAAMVLHARYHQRIRRTSRESIIWAALFFVVAVESLIDPTLTAWLGYDLTPAVHAFEGDAVAHVQHTLRARLLGTVLDLVGSAIYTYGYLLVYAGILGIALLRDDILLARPLLRSFLYVWCVGMPAYLFVPVNEPWYGSETVVNVLHTTMPPSAENPFLEYNINNELPSLHSALGVASATVLWRLRRMHAFSWAALPGFTLPFFVVYLGIHWVVDAVTGVLLGLGAAWLATRSVDASGKPEIPPPLSGAPNGGIRP